MLQGEGAFLSLAFHGGTAPRFLYGSRRYSEDLDFALEREPGRYDFRGQLRAIATAFSAEGYPVGVRVSDQRTIHSAFVRFVGLLHELGLSPHRDETLSAKIEVDTRPPAGATLATTVVRRYEILHLRHHDRASLFAGKLQALLQRPYTKGRDIYDLVWYLSDPNWSPPNLTMLNAALQQTGWTSPPLTAETWRAAVSARLGAMEWDRVAADVAPFLISSTELHALSRDAVLRLLDESG